MEKQIKKISGQIGLNTAIAVVVANMIGVGVFTTLSYQVISIDSNFAILMLWAVGGIVAICGALSYSELAAAMPRSGGEYHYLSKIYHPSLGFLSGWVSIVVGFAAPIAAASIAMSEYVSKIYPSLYPKVVACVVVIALAFLHGSDVRAGGIFQQVFTLLKILFVVFLIGAGFTVQDHQVISLIPTKHDGDIIFGGMAFAVSLVYVSYAYSGWNASAYIAGEIKNPKKNLPRSLILGTTIVMVLYIGINYIFLYTVPRSEMVQDFAALQSNPELAIGFLAGKHIFGNMGAKIVSALIAFGLVSTISSMTIAGPRVTQAMGEDFSVFRALSKTKKNGAPMIAVALQTLIAVVLILTSSFEAVLTYIGFTLAIFSSLTVAGVYILRIKEPKMERPYKTWGYPVTPAIFLALNFWMIYHLVKEKPLISLVGLGTIVVGFILYFVVSNNNSEKK